jgi:hypothetical protein
MVAGGWLYIHNAFDNEIDNARNTLNERETELSELQNLANQFSSVQANYNDVIFKRTNFPKELLPTNSSSDVFNYLQELNQDISFTGLNYSFTDSVINEDYGIVNVTVAGEGNYSNLTNFLYRIEHSRPIIQINSLQLNNIVELEKLNRVNFQLSMGAYYRRGNWTNYNTSLTASNPLGSINHNPYYPLIRPIPPNDENLPDVEASRLIALTGSRVHIIDQNGVLNRLSVGDRVYLGQLSEIDLENNEAIFDLNRGGIGDRIVLTLSQDNP